MVYDVKGQINIFVHVPLVNKLLLLLQISSSIALQLAPPDNILAVGHTTLTENSLTRYNKYGPLYFSDTAIPLHVALNSSCLGTIYSQDYENIKIVRFY